MAGEPTETKAAPPAEESPRKAAPRRRGKSAPKADTAPTETPEPKAKDEGPRVPRRADLPESQRTLMRARGEIDRRRPLFGRQARYRYYRIGRDMSWRAPRGLQSKQRRHYGYRPKVVRIGYRSPARVRGLVPSGFRPIIVHTTRDLEALDAHLEAAIIARTVGTRRRLVLEETARKLGIRVLNPIVKSEREA
ncbi:MAG TPA: 50S ribosomal protein L32e [Thermoplasmata archaeon]|nr:50S ribosomal protein L32e [Thermoplasmata archaeon]